jgi:regulatory protein YycI of two-component signal transduction system YycFG
MRSALLRLHIIYVFQMWSLLRRTYYLNEQETKYVSIYLNDDLRPQVKIATSSGHAVLNDTQCFILVTIKSEIPKNEVHELGDSRHTLSMYCGRYILIASENTHVHVSKKDWSQLMDLESVCIDR